MKKIRKLFALSLALCLFGNANAQSLIDGEFNTPVTQFYPPGTSCETFNATSTFNWFRSHGTPHLSPFTTPTSMVLVTYGGDGEGVVGGYYFHKNVSYQVSNKINSSCAMCGNGGYFYNTLYMYAANDIVEGALPPSPLCLEPFPTGYTMEWMQTRTLSSAGGSGINNFSFTPSTDYQQMWVFTSGATSTVGIDNVIDYIRINPDCETYQTKLKYYSSAIPSGYEKKGPFYISGSASNDAHNNTTMVSTSIFFGPNTILTTDENKYFEAIGVTGCTVVEDYPGPPGSPASPTDDRFSKFETNKLSVYPNPTSGSFKIKLGLVGNYDIRVVNTMGTTVYQAAIRNSNFLDVSDIGLPTGMYTVYVTNSNENGRFIEKLNIAR